MLKKKKRFFIPAVIAAATAFLALIGYIIIIFLGHYVIDEKKLILHASSKIVDQNGDEIASLYTENREPVSIQQVPEDVRDAFIAVEDKRFCRPGGVPGCFSRRQGGGRKHDHPAAGEKHFSDS